MQRASYYRFLWVCLSLLLSVAPVIPGSLSFGGDTRSNDSSEKHRYTTYSDSSYELIASAAGYDTAAGRPMNDGSPIASARQGASSKSGQVQDLDKMVVRMKRRDTKRAEQTASITRIDAVELQQTAGTANDINRVLQSLPSVVGGGSDLNNTMFVRGGHSRENVFVVDGIELENISHFSDLSSSGGEGIGCIDGAFINNLDFYTGSMPASLPPKMSAVADMQMRDGSRSERSYRLQLSSSGLGVTAEGPIMNQQGSYLVNMRYLNIGSLESFLPLNGKPQFGDGQSRLALSLDGHNDLVLTMLLSYDHYVEKHVPGGAWIAKILNGASGLQWKCTHERFNNRLLATMVVRNQLNNDEHIDSTSPRWDIWYKNGLPLMIDTVLQLADTITHIVGGLDQKEHITYNRRIFQVKDDATWYLRDNDQLRCGAYLTSDRFHLVARDGFFQTNTKYWLNAADPFRKDSCVTVFNNTMESFLFDTIVGGYVDYVVRQGSAKVVAGLRADYFRLHSDYGISPRCAISYRTPHAGTVTVSGGLYYQQSAEMVDIYAKLRTLGVPDPLSLQQVPTLSNVKLQRSWQGVLSWENKLWNSHSLTVETYYKWYDREYTMANPDSFQFETDFLRARHDNQAWSLAPPRGNKKAFGLELFLQKRQQHGLSYAIGYSLFSVQQKYADGTWYNDPGNVRNNVVLTLGYELFKRHNVAVRAIVNEGRPYCRGAIDRYGWMYYDTTAGYYSQRLDPMVSVSLRYNFSFISNLTTITGYIELWNVLNYSPVIERKVMWWGYSDHRDNGILPLIGLTADF